MSAAGGLGRPILVTGGTGQVGFELCRMLSPFGQVLAPRRTELDLESTDSIRRFVREARPSLIVNAAAYTAVDRAEEESDRALRINGEAPGVLAAEARRIGTAIIHYSTDYVFDGKKKAAYVESDSTDPINVYGRTKLVGEQAVRDAGGAWLILRCSWVYSMRGTNFLRTMLRLGAERPILDVVNDQLGSPTWAREIAHATAAIMGSPGITLDHLTGILQESSGIYHLSAAGSTSWFGFARAIFDGSTGLAPAVRPIPSTAFETAARRPSNSVLDNSLLYRVFGIQMPIWEDQLDRCLASPE